MPYIGLGGLHIIIALLCAVHVVRSGQPMYWLFILFAFPLLGSLVYIFGVYLPNSRLERGAMRAVAAAAKAIDPKKEVREARAAYADAPTAQNQMRLAAALLENGEAEEAARLYEGALKGPFTSDLEIRFGAARAFVECQRYPDALAHLEAIRAANPDFRPSAVSLAMARCYGGTSHPEEARREFESALAKYGTLEVRAEYAIWALSVGDVETATRLCTEIDKVTQKWSSVTRELNEPVMRRLRAANDLARRQAS
jgi:hypothetical protein